MCGYEHNAKTKGQVMHFFFAKNTNLAGDGSEIKRIEEVIIANKLI